MDNGHRPASLVRKLAWEVLTTIVPALLVALFVNMFVAEAVAIDEGPSMQPNLYVGYRVMTEKISYRFGAPERGDVVVADRPAGETALIKRVVAVAGEVVEVRGGHTYVNGQSIDEPWVTYLAGRTVDRNWCPPATCLSPATTGPTRAIRGCSARFRSKASNGGPGWCTGR